jgi:hypothetical protein
VPLGDWNLESGRRDTERERERAPDRFLLDSLCVCVCLCGEDVGAASDRVC